MAKRFTPFRRRSHDHVLLVSLGDNEVEALQWVLRDLAGFVEPSTEANPVSDRLYPRAYLDPTEEDAEETFQTFAHGDLVEGRLVAIKAVRGALDQVDTDGALVDYELDAEAETQWLTVLNDARLTLGTALGVTEDDQELDFPDDDPRAVVLDVYEWLGALQFVLLDVLFDDLPE